ncbi:hypothetical protein [Mycobacterium sp. RTGN4]|uniref:hypothetical protein n=1 Tax=Mycobacterium sp. RTGN4 TaxID=3016523 RepID=UPI0029C6CB1C|nr:hypothetical protein [Mycobacterium sp. RTGN4]
MASTIDFVVALAGGFLFDRAVGGWEVIVNVADLIDVRPLQILGVTTTCDLESVLTSDSMRPVPQMLAVDPGLFGSDARVRDDVLRSFKRRETEVAFLGSTRPDGLGRSVAAAQYQLSSAARAFKAQALRPTSTVRTTVAPTEVFLIEQARRPRGLADLAPARLGLHAVSANPASGVSV